MTLPPPSLQDLFGRIKDIQAKAEQSELMVQEICRDIKKLDYAKRNLTATITALRRLAMLVSAVDQLEALASKRIYREAAHMLEVRVRRRLAAPRPLPCDRRSVNEWSYLATAEGCPKTRPGRVAENPAGRVLEHLQRGVELLWRTLRLREVRAHAAQELQSID